MLLQDLRQALRTLASRPTFTAAAILSLALGIGAQTSVYALIRALFDRPPMGVAEPDEVLAISAVAKGRPVEDAIRFPDYLYLRDHNTVFSGLASHFNSGVRLFDRERAEMLDGHVVSANYFPVLGLTPRLGRFFLPEEDRVPDRDAVVVLSHSYWQRRFDGDVRSLGQTITLNGVPFIVIGVAAAGFEGAKISWSGDVFIPNMMARVATREVDVRSRNSARLDLLGRLKPGRRLADARVEMSMLAGQLAAAFPETNRDSGLHVADLKGVHPQARSATARLPRLLLSAVTCLLVIACVNLSGLLMARYAARRREIAIRLAIGAGRPRIIRQLLSESFLLSLAGGMAGLLIALLGNRMLERYYGVEIDSTRHLHRLTLDWATFGMSLSLMIVTALAIGLVPALQASSPALIPAIKDDPSLQGFRRSRLRSVFLVAQVGLSLVLLVCAGLLIRSVLTLRWDPGFDAEKIAFFRMRPQLNGYDDTASRAYFENVRRRLESLGEVESVAFARWPPALRIGSVPVSLPSPVSGESEGTLRVAQNTVTPDFFETLRIRIVRGRAFEDRDRREGSTSVVVNQALADRLWPNRDPVGETVIVNGKPHEVLGVAAYKDLAAGDAPAPFLFRGDSSSAIASGRLMVRVKGDAALALPLLRSQILAVDPSVAVAEALPLTRLVENLHSEVPLAMRVASFAGGLALLLSAIGLYSALALSVSQRTREIGIRMALGGRTASVVALVLRQGMTPALIGVGAGLFAAVTVSRLMSSLLLGVAPGDPLTFLAAASLLAAVSLAACSIPAWRAARVEPTQALRQSA
jgi:macrolide transport system ATP-binding/permease protein